ncbi:MAG: hypothetical protein KGZ25_08125 [Planctomycetes bacterium]|nr:hypothetical protein [Planctomycetota bacterium]
MLPIHAKTVYVDPDIENAMNCQRRLRRVLPNVNCDDVQDLKPDTIENVMRIGKRRHGKDDLGDDAVLVFTTFDEDRTDWFYHWRSPEGRHGGMCQGALELNIVDGCVFRCAYCGFGRYIIFYLNVERLIDGLDSIFEKYPNQRLYKYSNMTDLPPFEPELDAIPPMIERFADEADRYVMLFTKSHNVDFLTDLNHNGQTIISWSLSSHTVSREIDKRAATMEERIEAMARMQAAGYHVRARLSPIVPIANWREDYAELFEVLFDRVDPDVVTLELLGWMDFDDLTRMFGKSLFDPEALRKAKEAREELAGVGWGPFTQETHDEVYSFCIDTVQKISPGTAVAVCHGTPTTWKLLADKMQMSPDAYVCNCGPLSTPGGDIYDRWDKTTLSRT